LPGADGSDVVGRSLCADNGGRAAMRHIDYLEMMLRNGHAMAHDYSHQSTDEDPHMIAFFDSLVRRERDGWSSDDDDESISRDDDVDDRALGYHHTEQSSSDESVSDGNQLLQSGVVFRPLRYPQARDAGSSQPDGIMTVPQSTAVNSRVDQNRQSGPRRRRKTRRATLQRLGQMIPITSFTSSHSQAEDSSSDSTSTTTVDDSDNSADSDSSSTSETSDPADQNPLLCDSAEILDPCHETADSLTLKQSRDSLSRLKRLREHALNSDDDGGEFPASLEPAAKHAAVSNPIATAANFCDNTLDSCRSPVKLNGKPQFCSDATNGVIEISQLTDFPKNNLVTEGHESASVGSSACSDGIESRGATSVDQELCSILNQVSNGDATGVEASSADRFRSRCQKTRSGDRRYRRLVVDTEHDHTSDED